MDNFFEAALLILQGMSTAVIDIFYVLAAVITFMTHMRARQFRVDNGDIMRSSGAQTAETLFQGIAGGVVISLGIVFLGIVAPLDEGLMLLLPLSFVIGFFHIRYTNMIYSGLILGAMSVILQGQTLGDYTLPTMNLDLAGLLLILGILYLLMALLIWIGGQDYLWPIVAKKGDQRLLGFYGQKFWPVPLVLLLSVSLVLTGDTVPMPDWWPLIPMPGEAGSEKPLLIFPMLFIMNQGSVSFTKTPVDHHRWQIAIQGVSGLVMFVFGGLFRTLELPGWPLLILLAAIGFVPDILWHMNEDKEKPLYNISKGIFVGKVEKDTLAKVLGFKVGDQLLSVNGEDIQSLKGLIEKVKAAEADMILAIHREGVGEVTINVNRLDFLDVGFGLRVIPEQPAKIFDYKLVENMGMMHLLIFRNVMKDKR